MTWGGQHHGDQHAGEPKLAAAEPHTGQSIGYQRGTDDGAEGCNDRNEDGVCKEGCEGGAAKAFPAGGIVCQLQLFREQGQGAAQDLALPLNEPLIIHNTDKPS